MLTTRVSCRGPNLAEPDANTHDRPWFQASWGRLEQIVEQFEGAWQSGQRPAIDAYLQVADVEPRRLLVELAHADLECRLKAGEAARVEIYFERYAELAADPRAALRLIAAEYDLRRRREPGLGLEEYLRRFPQYRADLPECLPGPHQRTAEPPSSSQQLGQFELLEPVGQGAFGTVYRARDAALDRIVAVKVPRGDRSITPADADRFTREARNAAQLTHPGIVPVYEVGQAAVPYIVSAYVEGMTLAETLNGRRLDFSQAAEVMAQVAEALDHAHRQGVVHRDLKPSNIMLGRIQGSGPKDKETGRQVDKETAPRSSVSLSPCLPVSLSPDTMRAFVMDFGLARREEGEIHLTVEGQILGTPAYMSPEQASGQSHRVDGRSDLYSLGVILYELLTGEVPFRGAARMVLQQILDDEPRPPRRLNDQVPRNLETIALKCMAKEPGRRYPTAGDLAADLRRHLGGAPILARPVGRFERTRLWAKRNPRVAGLSTAVVALLLTTAIGATAAFFIINAQKNAEMLARAQAEESGENARRLLDLTLDTLDKVVNELQERLGDQPALFELREILLTKAIDGLQRVAAISRDANTDPNLSSAQERLGDIFLQLGRAAEAREQYERFQEIVKRRVASDPMHSASNPACVAAAKLGEACLRMNDMQAALDYCEEAAAGAETQRRLLPKSRIAARDLAFCSSRLGAVQMRRGQISAAADSFGRAVDMGEAALVDDALNRGAQRDLAAAYENLGDARLQLGRVKEAGWAFDHAMQLRTALATASPTSADAQRAVAVSYEKLGVIAMRSNDVKAAQEAYGQALVRRKSLADAAPKNSLLQRDLSIAYGKLGEVSEKRGDLSEARAYYEKALKPFEALRATYPSDARLRRDCAVAYLALGLVNRRLGEQGQAELYRQKALKAFQQAAEAVTDDVSAQADLAICWCNIGRTEMDAREYAVAIRHFEEGVAILRNLEARGRLGDQPIYQAWFREHQQNLEFCREAQRAIDDLDFALRQPAKAAIKLLSLRAAALAVRGQHAEAVRTTEKLRGIAPNDPAVLYEVARCYALCAPVKPANQLTTEECARREQYTALALEALKEAVTRGFSKLSQLKSDPDLAAIRSASDFQNLLRQLEPTRPRRAP